MYRWRLWDVSWVFLVLKVIVWHMEQRKIPGTRNLVLQQIWQQPIFIFDPSNCIEYAWEAWRCEIESCKPFKVVRVERGGLKVKRLLPTAVESPSYKICQGLNHYSMYLIKLKAPMNSSHQKIRKVCQNGISKQELPINVVLSDITGSTMNAHMLTLQGSKLPTNYLLPRQLLTCSAPQVDPFPLPNLTKLTWSCKEDAEKGRNFQQLFLLFSMRTEIMWVDYVSFQA